MDKNISARGNLEQFLEALKHTWLCMSERVPVLIYQCGSEKYDRNVS